MSEAISKEASFWNYWGKAQPKNEGPAWHPLVCHSLDVGAVANGLIARHHRLRQRLAALAGLSEAATRKMFTLFALLHDAGKFMDTFQGLVEDLFDELRGPQGAQLRAYSVRHDTLGYLALVENLDPALCEGLPLLGEHGLLLEAWLSAATGHHGRPPLSTAELVTNHASEENLLALHDFVEFCKRLVDFEPDSLAALQHNERGILASSWFVAGALILADWLGSSQQYFPYQRLPASPTVAWLEQYWKHAQQRAIRALLETEVLPKNPANAGGMHALFPAFTPSPLQALADSVPLSSSSQLFIIEDIAGSGKTEATLTLASRLMAANRASGLYFALPTMATANGLYPRLREHYRALFQADQFPSLTLAHGAAHLQAKLKKERERWTCVAQDESSYAVQDETASAHCARWIADSSKRSLLADVGVGTIDQVLLAALPVKHGALRQLGLLGKVLVVDEVHAYDDYMLALLETLLTLHATGGGSAVLLSATMPIALRQRLARAYAAGCNGAIPELARTEYPLLTRVDAESVSEQPCAPRGDSARSMDVVFLEEPSQVLAFLDETAASQRCAVWIRNTVDDAIGAYEELTKRLPSSHVHLFHARFCMGHRLDIEADILRRFGATSSAADRAGHILIATQVVEQSLDLDFDEMVTDLCPIDLIIQRAGRLRRHARTLSGDRLKASTPDSAEALTDQRGAIQLHLLAPRWSEHPESSWLSSTALRKAENVYGDPSVLWRSMKVLKELGRIHLPDFARRLIESVYSQHARGLVPAGLREGAMRHAKELGRRTAKGNQNRLVTKRGYVPDRQAWESEEHTPTRLSEPTVRLRLVERASGDIRGLYKTDDEELEQALSEVTVRNTWLTGRPSIVPAQRDSTLVVELERTADGVWQCPAGATERLRYDLIKGLQRALPGGTS